MHWRVHWRRWIPALGLALFYWLCRRAYYVGFFNDDAFHIIGARALLEGRYVELNHPLQVPLIHYTPGTSLLLLPVAWLFPDRLIAYQLVSITLTVVGVIAFHRLLREDLTPTALAATTLLTAINPLVASLSGAVLSDVPFFAATPLALLLVLRNWTRRDAPAWLAVGIAAAFLFYLRPIGAAYGVAVAVALAVRRRWRPAMTFTAAATALVAPYLIRNQLLRQDWMPLAGEFAAPFAARSLLSLATGWMQNLAYYADQAFVMYLFRWPALTGRHVLSGAAVIIGVVMAARGFRGLDRKDGRVIIWLFAAIYLAVLLAWDRQVGRYLLPMLPLAFALFFRGITVTLRRTRAAAWGVPIASAAALLLLSTPLRNIVRISLFQKTPVNTPASATFDWIRAHTAPTDVVGTEWDGRVYLYTARRTLHLPPAGAGAGLLGWLQQNSVDYILSTATDMIAPHRSGNRLYQPLSQAELDELLINRPGYRLVYQNEAENTRVFEVKKQGEPPQG